MAYLALYREWRPQNFREMVGQEHVRTTLINALIRNKVAHAYLFSGPRGTGKTTAAKILAKALNCEDRDYAEPCNKCTSCRNIDQGLAMDVMEIDAASNRGIDEIRDLREKVKLAASGGKYKVYIIDEVHMLTTEAFNALLKTLEEPPASVIFVLATTEAYKVPLTILSRVQRFEFHRISTVGIIERLQEVTKALGRDVEEKALQVIAKKAEGGLRDALSILDQCLLQDDPVRIEQLYQVIGMVGETYSADLTEALLKGDYGMALAKLGEGIALGRDPRQIIRELLDYLRQALLYRAGGQEPLLSPDVAQRLIDQSKQAGLHKLLFWINVLLKGEGELRYASNARLAAELILVQVMYEENIQRETEQGIASQPEKTVVTKIAKQTDIKPTYNKPLDIKPENKLINNKPIDLKAQDANDASNLLLKWPQILEEVRKKKRSTHAFLLEGKPVELKENTLTLLFKEGYSFHRDKFNQPENKLVVEEVLAMTMGTKIILQNLMESEYGGLADPFGSDATKKKVKQNKLGYEHQDENDYCIAKAVECFGTELVHVIKEK